MTDLVKGVYRESNRTGLVALLLSLRLGWYAQFHGLSIR
jgi:hypothetical protein